METSPGTIDKLRPVLGADLARLRETNPAWRLLASPLAPYVLSCLKQLFGAPGQHILQEDMETSLARILLENANREEVEENYLQQARRELREWIRRGLISERSGILYATDELQRTMDFINSLETKIMTSTASRLATVQKVIAELALQLSPDAVRRETELRNRITELERELERVKGGEFEVKSGRAAIEGIREVYDLATSLHTDFRRVEDSFRRAEKDLRESLIRDGQHRGIALDKLLDNHDELIETPEGQVFAIFHEQLSDSMALDLMRQQLKEITEHALETEALNRQQRHDLLRLVARLIEESRQVFSARSRSDRDVKSFIKSGLAAEHLAVGRLLNGLFEAALDLDFSQQAVRRSKTPLPLIAVNLAMIPTPERLKLSALEDTDELELDLTQVAANIDEFDETFWNSFASLDREEFYEQVLELLIEQSGTMTLGEIITSLKPDQDFEAVAYLLELARESKSTDWQGSKESFEIKVEDCRLRYQIPHVELSHSTLRSVSWEAM